MVAILVVAIIPGQDGQSIVDNIIKQYKKGTLKLREDAYQDNLPILDSYDFVIVGASPSGCVLANRLTDDPGTTVLLLEAGPEPTYFNDVPLLSLLIFETEYNWKYESQYNPKVCRSMNSKTCPWPNGRCIGGGTCINAMIYTRGNKRDYDRWAEEGNTGWGYNDLLKYFVKLEDVRIENLRNSPYRGKNGPIGVSYSPYSTNGSIAFLKAAKELDYPEIDYNQPYKAGFSKLQLTIKDGGRSSAANAYLKPVTNRKNLHVVQRSFVTKILIDPVTKTALGVEFFKKGKRREVRARKEVILSAGALSSPKVLMLSGIGPKDHLKKLNIKTIQDLPVGSNLQEHIGVTHLPFISSSPNFTLDYGGLIVQLPLKFVEYQRTKSGPLSSCGVDVIGYVSSRYSTDENPDIELMFVSASYASDGGSIIRKSYGLSDNVYNRFYKELEKEKRTFSIWVMGSYPKSRGSVRLASNNPFDPPVITNNFLNYTEDLNVVIDGIKKAIALVESDAMKPYNVRVHKKKLPGCEDFEFGSDDYWGCTVRQITAQYHHPSGTCKMGLRSDPTTVVDSRLRIHGIKRLRVVDVSIMPTITGGHTMAPAYMIGEKAADMIKQDN